MELEEAGVYVYFLGIGCLEVQCADNIYRVIRADRN
jgi:hypothetical protein